VTTMAQPVHRLTIAHARARGRRMIAVRGAVDLDTAPGLFAVLARAARTGDPLVLDLTEAEAHDENGMALLVNGVRRVHRLAGDVVVVCPAGAVRTVLECTALTRRVTVLDESDALAGAAPLVDRGAGVSAVVGGHRQRITTPGRRATLLAEATVAIENGYADPELSLDGVAREIATSSRQLQRVFAELAGSAFRDELAAVRMQHGATMLVTTDVPVAAIARRVGYRQAAQFAKAFRRHHGVSPTGLRRFSG
jgi:AraC family transcriptional regulator, regulatory protein of adaptative response / methylphosphotriester-DNA alkyltransferase methyltransferase